MTTTSPDLRLNGLDVLVLEDDASSAFLISSVLSRQGIRVETATNGSDGFLRFQEQRFQIVIIDIKMTDMNGLELANSFKTLDRDIQIIATSEKHEADRLVSAIEFGFSDYFLKPIEIGKLLLAVKRCADVIAVKQQLEEECGKFKTVVDCLGEGIVIKDLDNRIVYQNRALTEMFGNRIGSECYEIFGLNEPCQDCPAVRALEDGEPRSSCMMEYRHNGTVLYIESTASLLRDSHGTVTGSVEIIRDISERIINEQTIHKMAFHDPLTGLSNRRLFEDRLEQAIAKSRRYGMQFGLLTLDLDHFKDINDTFGHVTGDKVLQEAAERIRSCCKRDLDTISRQGGDEFCIIFADCGDRSQLAAIAEKLLEQFSRPFQLAETTAEVTTSIGISIYPDNGTEMKELEITSDRAMYAAKKAGRNTYRFWEPYANPDIGEDNTK